MVREFLMGVFLLGIGATTAVHAQGDTLYVPLEYPTIQAAIDAAAPAGDVVIVDPGIYRETVGWYTKSLTLASRFLLDGNEHWIEETVFHADHGMRPLVISNVSGEARLSGFTIYGHQLDCSGGAGLIIYFSSASLSNLRFIENRTRYHGGGIWCMQSQGTMTEVLFTGNDADTWGAAVALQHSEFTLSNVTIADNPDDVGAIALTDAAKLYLRNAILWNNGPCSVKLMDPQSPSQVDLYCSLVNGEIMGTGLVTGGEGCFDQDPRFCDAPELIFTLRHDSPCLPGNHPEWPWSQELIGAYGEGCPGAAAPLSAHDAGLSLWHRRCARGAAAFEIGYRVPRGGRAGLAVFDLQGRLATLLVDGSVSAGDHRAVWDASGRPSGIYYCRLAWGGSERVRRLVHVR